jgi:hypothetical protein
MAEIHPIKYLHPSKRKSGGEQYSDAVIWVLDSLAGDSHFIGT